MNKKEKILMFLVDDDALFLKSLEIDFQNLEAFEIQTFPTGESCLKNLYQNPAMVILDYHLNGIDLKAMDGLATLDAIKIYNTKTPVIMLSSQDKIEVAINCMHHRATDYVVKSETAFVRLQQIIETIFHYQKIEKQLFWYMERM
jgi:two-component system OmpR family response regulator